MYLRTLSASCLLLTLSACNALPNTYFGSSPATPETRFEVTLENISASDVLQTSMGGQPAPVSPGAWAVHSSGTQLFREGQPDPKQGIEGIAEDANPAPLAMSLQSNPAIHSSGTFTIPEGDTMAGPITSGKRFRFTVTGKPGDLLSFVTMFGQSNDGFYAPDPMGLPLFNGSQPRQGDVTAEVYFWDNGSEQNEEPGVGPNQAARQMSMNQGTPEMQPIRRMNNTNDGFTYPATNAILRISLRPLS